ncbi:integral membrane protein [Haematobacter missouriensis]|nr:integral membrane protein [Haematobacter missouriensis]
MGRDALSILFSMVVYAGYGLLLTAAMALSESRGHHAAGAREGLLWGLGGFLAVQFLPAAGLPPELPGMATADLGARQIWWLLTVAASAIGIWLIAFGRNWLAWGVAIVLLALPHVVGAPHPHEFTGPTPPELASQFAGRALGVGFTAWLVLGLFSAQLLRRVPGVEPVPRPV